MQSFPAIYRAKAIRIRPNQHAVQAYIPQVFGDTSVTIVNFLGGLPTATGMGWVTFQGGNPDFPVWMGAGIGGEGGPSGPEVDEVWVSATEPTDPDIELWYDPSASMMSMEGMWLWQGPSTLRAVPTLADGELATDTIPSEASEAFFSPLDASGNINWSQTLSAQAPGDTVYLQHAVNTSSWHLYEVTGEPHQEPDGTWCIPVTTDSGSPPGTAPPQGEPILVQFRAASEPAAGGSYMHTQSTPASTWVITHGLNFYPNVTVVDSAGDEVVGEVTYSSINTVAISFSGAFSGSAFLS